MKIGILTLAVSLVSSEAFSQETTGDIRGRLRSSGGAPIAGATVIATSPDMLGMRRAATASDGVFQLLSLPPGWYSLRVTAIGFRPLLIDSVRVHLGRTQGLPDTPLEATSVQLSEVRIVAPPLALDPARTTIGATLESRDLAVLPAEGDYKSLITTLPHVNTSYHGDAANSAGSTGLENVYFVDGVNVTLTLTAATSTGLPANFVRSVEVRGGGYEARYGRALGAIVNGVTWTGSNTFETNLFGYVTGDGMSATARAEPVLREAGSSTYDIGARVSGPVVRDRLWFSAAWNPRWEHIDRIVGDLGTYSDDRRAHSFAGKLTWQPTPAVRAEFLTLGDPATHDQVEFNPRFSGMTPRNVDPYLRRAETGGIAVSASANAVLGSSLLVEAALMQSTRKNNSFAATTVGASEPLYLDDVVDRVLEGGIGFPGRGEEGRVAGSLRGTLTRERHTIVAGLEWEDTRAFTEIANTGNGIILRLATDNWLVIRESAAGTYHNRTPTAYLQDSWRLTSSFTLNAGLRWSSQTLTGASGGTAQRFPNEWQPRLGFSWQLNPSGQDRVFGSLGRFYQQTPLLLSSLWYVDYLAENRYFDVDPRTPSATPVTTEVYTTPEESFAQSIDGLEVENFDEWSLAYERLIGRSARLTLRAMHRNLRSSFQWGFIPGYTGDSAWVLGTPGKGRFDYLPPPRREYVALEAGVDGSWNDLTYRASYVLSRNTGNYSGLYSTDLYTASPGGNFSFFTPGQARNSDGLLPNDRTHVLKLAATFTGPVLTIGALVSGQSGTPLNAFGAGPFGPVGPPMFLYRRGSIGRTPFVWGLNARVARSVSLGSYLARVTVDALHLGNFRTTIRQDMQRFLSTDEAGNPKVRNPDFLKPTGFQPPAAVRVGVELSWRAAGTS